MSEIVQITDYDTDTLNKILEQFKDSTNLKGIVESANTSANDIEQALFEIRDEFWITTAVGTQLDVLGIIWDVQREGLSDTDYRTKILSKISLNVSGEPEVIISILKLLFGATFVTYLPFYPAGFYIYNDSDITIDELELISPSGVQSYLLQDIHDANGNYLADANGNPIVCVRAPIEEFELAFEDGTVLSYEDGDTLLIIE